MGYLIAAFFLLIISFILSLALKGKPQQKAEGILNEILTGSLGQMLLGAAIVLVIAVIVFAGVIATQ